VSGAPLAGRAHEVLDDEGLTVATLRTNTPRYVYVASSWRNPIYPDVLSALRSAGIGHYDFRNPNDQTGFSWKEVGGADIAPDGFAPPKGADLVPVDQYLRMLAHPRARGGFDVDFAHLRQADTCILILPCGRSAHLELGWAAAAGKNTAILLEDPAEPELMYRMVDYLAPDLDDLLRWLGAGDT
jgi:hypothetical protein